MRIAATFFLIVLTIVSCNGSNPMTEPVIEEYQPKEPIEFPHDIHAGELGIDCKYCHSGVEKPKSDTMPATNVCMNCHRQIQGAEDQQ